mmetsp:Transcript_121877/g.248826  ORF Transcript_121877/g.248826 Transcript_121877/m.248826 type:complete len:97 (-) Transcript_121877:3734-4024(-)
MDRESRRHRPFSNCLLHPKSQKTTRRSNGNSSTSIMRKVPGRAYGERCSWLFVFLLFRRDVFAVVAATNFSYDFFDPRPEKKSKQISHLRFIIATV